MKNEDESNRRKFLKISGGAIIAAGSAGLFNATAQHHRRPTGSAGNDPLGSATVSFGGWLTDFTPPLDRFTSPLPPPPANHHELIPNTARIKAGGYVNFIISGLHVVAIYGEGARGPTRPADIDTTILTPLGGPLPPVISDPDRRIYRGPNPVVSPGPPPVIDLDRVEVVHFDTPGTYLVICAVLPHFNEGMFGYVRVLSADEAVAKAVK